MEMSSFAKAIYERTYAMGTPEGKETWDQTAHRVAKNVMRAVGVDMRSSLAKEIREAITKKQFMPGGRYLYSSGRPYHQCCNCYGGETKAVTDKGAVPLRDLVGKRPTLMTTNGEWKKSEVKSFGVQKLYAVTLSFAGSKKVIYATANHSWRVATGKGANRLHGKKKVDTIDLKPGDALCQVFGHGMSRTFVSPHGAIHGFVFGDGAKDRGYSRVRLCNEKTELSDLFKEFPQTSTYYPDILVLGLPGHYKQRPSLEWGRSYLLGWLAGYFAADGYVSKEGQCTLTSVNKSDLEFVKDVAYIVGIGVNSIRENKSTGYNDKTHTLYSVSFRTSTLTREFFLRSKHRDRFEPSKRESYWNVVSVEETDREEEVYCAVVPDTHEFVLEDNILVGNCLLMRVHDSREGWSEITGKAMKALMTGAGIGIVYSDVRHEGANIRKTGGTASGPLPLMQVVNECGRGVMQGGTRRSAIWAGLHWDHPDIHKFVRIKNWKPEVHELKNKDFAFPATLDHTNISVILDDKFFEAYHDDEHSDHAMAHSVYWAAIEQMMRTGEPGFSIDTGKNNGENLRNAPLSASTRVLTDKGYQQIGSLVGKETTLWTGSRWAPNCVFQKTASDVKTVRVVATGGRVIDADPSHEFFVERYVGTGYKLKFAGIEKVPASELDAGDILHTSLPIRKYSEVQQQYVKVMSVEEGPVEDVFCCDVHLKEHSFVAEGVVVSNCTEITSRDTDDICNLGSLNLANIDSLEEMKRLVEISTAFLLAGSVYTDVPYADVDKILSKNRRLGLGLMGIHEWLLKRGRQYGPDEELGRWLKAYAKSGSYANKYADEWGISRPKKTRAVAPTGTISIVAETTGGIEPIFCAAYKRRYLKGDQYCYQYVLDPCAKRLVAEGVDPDSLEDAYDLARNVERRVAFQAWVQQFVDHGISSTINLPQWGSEDNNSDLIRSFGSMLIRYLPNLRGITTYPDGSRGGQPLNPVPYREAEKQEGSEVVEEQVNVCDLRGGSCGD